MLGYGSVWREICMREEARRWERIGNFGEARRGGRGGGGLFIGYVHGSFSKFRIHLVGTF